MQLIHTEQYNKKDLEEKINMHNDMDYQVKSMAINLINQLKPEDFRFITIDPEYNRIKVDVNRGAYYVNTELGDSVEFESTDKSLVKKFKLVGN